MKNLTKIFMALAVALFAFSCVNDTTEDAAVKVGGKTTLTLSLDDTRTELGEAENGLYPVVWSVEDQISVNGIASEGLTFADGAGTANAVFTFNTESLSTPYCVAYPAAEKGYVVFAEEQIHNNSGTTFDVGAATMYGYSNGGSVKLNHLTGVLKIGVVGTATLKSATISTIDRAPIAGAFAIDFTTGKVTPTENSTHSIVYQFPGFDGLYLDETEPTYLHIAVPAGTYDELYVTLEDSEGGVMYATVTAGDNKPLVAGRVREFAEPITYAPINANEVYIIKDYDSFIAWRDELVALTTAETTTTKNTVFVNDVVIPEGTSWSPKNIKYYRGTIYGNGYAIKNLNNRLFAYLRANVHGLHLENVNISHNSDVNNYAAFTSYWYGEKFTHCSASGTITVGPISAKSMVRIGGLIAVVFAAGAEIGIHDVEISNCVNNMNINVEYKASDSSASRIGGIFGQYDLSSESKATETSKLTLKNNVNNGTITTTGSTWAQVRTGGIFGDMFACNLLVYNCVNNGNINWGAQETANSATRPVRIGGICGYMYTNITKHKRIYSNCVNNGNITINTPRILRGFYVGGILGDIADTSSANNAVFEMKNCTNNGVISSNLTESSTVHSSVPESVYVYGGVIGGMNMNSPNTKVTFENLVNTKEIKIEGFSAVKTTLSSGQQLDPNASLLYAGGIIGRMKGDGTTVYEKVDNLVNTGNVSVTHGVTGANKEKSHIGGIVGLLLAPMTNAKCYATVQAYNVKADESVSPYPNTGMVTGSASGTVTNSAIGGKIVLDQEYELTADNYAKYLFSNRDLTEYAGVTLLTSAPAAN